MASAKFLRRQAEKSADLARLTNDEDARQRYEQLQHTYRFLAEAEETKRDKAFEKTRFRPATYLQAAERGR